MIILNIITASASTIQEQSRNKSNNKEIERNKNTFETDSGTNTATLLHRANAQIRAQTRKKIQSIEDKLRGLESTRKLLKKNLKIRLQQFKEAYDKLSSKNISRKKLMKHARIISQGVKVLRGIEFKTEKSLSKDTKQISGISKLIRKHTQTLQSLRRKKKELSQQIIDQSADLEKNIKLEALSPIRKNNLVNDLDSKTNILGVMKKVTSHERQNLSQLLKKKKALKELIKKHNDAFRVAFNNVFKKLNTKIIKENEEVTEAAKDFTNGKPLDIKEDLTLEKGLIRKEKVKAAIRSDKKEKNLENSLKHGSSSAVLEQMKEVQVDRTWDDNLVGDSIKKHEERMKNKEEFTPAKLQSQQAFMLNEDIDTLRKKVVGDIREARIFVQDTQLKNFKKEIHTLISDQEALRDLFDRSLEQGKKAERDIVGRSVRTLKKFHRRSKLIKSKENELKEELELYKASEVLNVNSVKLTGLLFNLKHMNDNYKGKIPQINDNSIWRRGETPRINYRELEKEDPDIQEAIQKIFNNRKKILRKHSKLNVDSIKKLTERNESYLKFIENQTSISNKNLESSLSNAEALQIAKNKSSEERGLLLNQYNQIAKELKYHKKETPKKMGNLVNQINNNKKLIQEFERELSLVSHVSSDEKDFIKGLTSKIDRIKAENKQYYSQIIFNLKNENKHLEGKVSDELKIIKEMTNEAKTISNVYQKKGLEVDALKKQLNTEKKKENSINHDYINLLEIKNKSESNLKTSSKEVEKLKLKVASLIKEAESANNKTQSLEKTYKKTLAEKENIQVEAKKEIKSLKEQKDLFEVETEKLKKEESKKTEEDQKYHNKLDNNIKKLTEENNFLKSNLQEYKNQLEQVEARRFKVENRTSKKKTVPDGNREMVTEDSMKKKQMNRRRRRYY